MRRFSTLFLLIVFLLSTLTGCGFLRKVFRRDIINKYPYFVTAKKWFPVVDEKAKSWRADATLYGIVDTEINMDGEGGKWEFLYDSPKADKQAVVKLDGGFVSLREEGRTVLTSAKGWYLDSNAAMKQANNAGGKAFLEKYPKAKILISLITELPNTRKKQTAWFVKYQGQASVLYIVVDAATGKIVWKNLVKYF